MKKFLAEKQQLLELMLPFMEKYNFEFKQKGTYTLSIENDYCTVVFYTERYEDSLITVLIDKETDEKYSYVQLVKLKGAPDLLSDLSESDDLGLKSKVLTTLKFLDVYAKLELLGGVSIVNKP